MWAPVPCAVPMCCIHVPMCYVPMCCTNSACKPSSTVPFIALHCAVHCPRICVVLPCVLFSLANRPIDTVVNYLVVTPWNVAVRLFVFCFPSIRATFVCFYVRGLLVCIL